MNNYPYMNYQPTIPQSPPPQNNTLVRVRSEAEAWNFPVAPGNSVLFFDENAQYIYSKTADVSQLDKPKLEKFKLVKDEGEPIQTPVPQQVDLSGLATKEDLLALKAELENLIQTNMTVAPAPDASASPVETPEHHISTLLNTEVI